MERRLLAEYEATLATIRENLAPENHKLAVALARYPEKIRGFGHVKAAAVERVPTLAMVTAPVERVRARAERDLPRDRDQQRGGHRDPAG